MTAVNYLWNPLNDNIVREFDDAGATVAEYTTESDEFGNVISQRRDGEDGYFHFDGVGSTLAVTNQAGTVTDSRGYSAFGETTEESGITAFPFQFVGRHSYYLDKQNEEYSVRRRHYDPPCARWFSIDPISITRRRDKSGTGNAYSYSDNFPTIGIDPSGLSLCTPMPPQCPQRHAEPTWYGCFCGGGNPPDGAPARTPIDPLDNSCQAHDTCYVANGCAAVRIVPIDRFPFFRRDFDEKPACVACDRVFCRALRTSTCNRYGPGSPEFDLCVAYRNAAMLVFECEGRFGIPPFRLPE